MSSPSEVLKAIEEFSSACSPLTELYGDDVGKIIYRALIAQERPDGVRGFGPNDLWNISNQDLISLLKKAIIDVRIQAENKSGN